LNELWAQGSSNTLSVNWLVRWDLFARFLDDDRAGVQMAKTPYAAVAKKWAEDPAARDKVKMVCISCHEPNRLGNRVELSHAVK